MPEILIGRQPIFDRYQQVIAYELLYRSLSPGGVVDGDRATTQLILNTFSGLDLNQLVGDRPAFINFTRSFLTGQIPIPFPPQRVVLEVLEDIPVDNPLVQSLTALAGQGYQIALDDVTSVNQVARLLRLAHIVKIDLRGLDRPRLAQLVGHLRQTGRRLLAEKVETQAELEYCRRLGFDFFQGYFLCRPTIVRGRGLDSSRLVLLRLLAQAQDPAADFRRLGQLVAQDVTLSYKLLKLVNSAYYSRREPVTAIEQAIALIGLNQLRGWLTLLHMTAVDHKPPELIHIALVRARLCERLARAVNAAPPDTCFLAGLLSVLDALMDLPMAEVITSLPLAEPVRAALLDRAGPAGQILKMAVAYEQADWGALAALPLEPGQLNAIFMDAIRWAKSLMEATHHSAPA